MSWRPHTSFCNDALSFVNDDRKHWPRGKIYGQAEKSQISIAIVSLIFDLLNCCYKTGRRCGFDISFHLQFFHTS